MDDIKSNETKENQNNESQDNDKTIVKSESSSKSLTEK